MENFFDSLAANLADIATIKKNKILQSEGYHDSSVFCHLVKAFQASRDYQGLSPDAFAEVVYNNMISYGLKTRDKAVISGHLIECGDYRDKIDGEDAQDVLPTLPEWKQKKITDYLDNRFDYPW